MGGYFSTPIPPNAIGGKMPVIAHPPGETTTTSWKYHYRVPLPQGQKFLFDGWNIGTFHLTGGLCDYFTVEINPQPPHSHYINIFDAISKECIFSANTIGHRVTIQNDQDGSGGSSVILTSAGTHATALPIPIRTSANEEIATSGKRCFIITGNDCRLVNNGWGTVTITGNVQSIVHEGRGHLTVKGSVKGDLKLLSCSEGVVDIDGTVEGDLIQEGWGQVFVMGDVKGAINQQGYGEIGVQGKLHGKMLWAGLGGVKVVGENWSANQSQQPQSAGGASGDA